MCVSVYCEYLFPVSPAECSDVEGDRPGCSAQCEGLSRTDETPTGEHYCVLISVTCTLTTWVGTPGVSS